MLGFAGLDLVWLRGFGLCHDCVGAPLGWFVSQWFVVPCGLLLVVCVFVSFALALLVVAFMFVLGFACDCCVVWFLVCCTDLLYFWVAGDLLFTVMVVCFCAELLWCG